jgi:hypothetical protein
MGCSSSTGPHRVNPAAPGIEFITDWRPALKKVKLSDWDVSQLKLAYPFQLEWMTPQQLDRIRRYRWNVVGNKWVNPLWLARQLDMRYSSINTYEPSSATDREILKILLTSIHARTGVRTDHRIVSGEEWWKHAGMYRDDWRAFILMHAGSQFVAAVPGIRIEYEDVVKGEPIMVCLQEQHVKNVAAGRSRQVSGHSHGEEDEPWPTGDGE